MSAFGRKRTLKTAGFYYPERPLSGKAATERQSNTDCARTGATSLQFLRFEYIRDFSHILYCTYGLILTVDRPAWLLLGVLAHFREPVSSVCPIRVLWIRHGTPNQGDWTKLTTHMARRVDQRLLWGLSCP